MRKTEECTEIERKMIKFEERERENEGYHVLGFEDFGFIYLSLKRVYSLFQLFVSSISSIIL